MEDIAVCKLCYNDSTKDIHVCEISSGKSTSTNQRRHLEKHHATEFEKQIKEVARSRISAEDGGEQLISVFFKLGPLASDRQTNQALFDEAMCEYLVKKCGRGCWRSCSWSE